MLKYVENVVFFYYLCKLLGACIREPYNGEIKNAKKQTLKD